MGCCFTRAVSSNFSLNSLPTDLPSVLLLGLDGAGKSSIFYRLKINLFLSTQPTRGYNVDVVSPVKGLKFIMWDVGGQDRLRAMWNHYYSSCKAIIFVVDSTDSHRFSEVRTVLHEIMSDPSMPESIPVLVMANKQDVQCAFPPEQIAQHLDTHIIERIRRCEVIGTSAFNGNGIDQAMIELKKALRDTDEQTGWV